MESNPITDQLQAEREAQKARDAYRYPFHVVCVYSVEESYDFPVVHDVKRHCIENHLTFMARPYDHEKYPDDMCIYRLPAFHVYHRGCVQATWYYDLDPVHKLNILRWAYDDEQKAKERARLRRQERWDSFKETISGVFSLDRFRSKPALDRNTNLPKRLARLSNTEGKTSEEPSRPHQTQRRGSQSGPQGLSQVGEPGGHRG